MCAFEIEFAFSFALAEALFAGNERLIGLALLFIGAISIYEETAVKKEHISDNRKFSEETVDAVVLPNPFSQYIPVQLSCLISTIFQLLKENVV